MNEKKLGGTAKTFAPMLTEGLFYYKNLYLEDGKMGNAKMYYEKDANLEVFKGKGLPFWDMAARTRAYLI